MHVGERRMETRIVVAMLALVALAVGRGVSAAPLRLGMCAAVAPPRPCPTSMRLVGLPVLQQALTLGGQRPLPWQKSMPWPARDETRLFPSLIIDWTCCNQSAPSDLVFTSYDPTHHRLDVWRDVASTTHPDLAEYIAHLGRIHAANAPVAADAAPPAAAADAARSHHLSLRRTYSAAPQSSAPIVVICICLVLIIWIYCK